MSSVAGDLGRSFAVEVSDRPSVAEIWVSTATNGVHLWLLAREIDAAEERSLYRSLEALDRRFGDIAFELHILKPASYSIPLHDVLPPDAEKIFPRAV
ncbi:MAG: hypothetical protein U0893_20285 [Chloroflexota bacterium]